MIDDEEVNIRLLQRTLAGAGYENVVCTTNPMDAARLFAESSPDLVLLDLHMPGADGFQVLRDLANDLEANGHVPVLMLTGDDSPEAKRGALALGARDFVTKPFDNLEVLLRIENLLENRFIHRALENQNVVLEERVKERTHNLDQSQLEILERLARAAELGRGPFTGGNAPSATPLQVGQGERPAGVTFTSVSAGATHTCGVGSDGAAYCWGSNIRGALGNTLQAAFRGLPQRVATPQ